MKIQRFKLVNNVSSSSVKLFEEITNYDTLKHNYLQNLDILRTIDKIINVVKLVGAEKFQLDFERMANIEIKRISLNYINMPRDESYYIFDVASNATDEEKKKVFSNLSIMGKIFAFRRFVENETDKIQKLINFYEEEIELEEEVENELVKN